jgi:hypothetical protein
MGMNTIRLMIALSFFLVANFAYGQQVGDPLPITIQGSEQDQEFEEVRKKQLEEVKEADSQASHNQKALERERVREAKNKKAEPEPVATPAISVEPPKEQKKEVDKEAPQEKKGEASVEDAPLPSDVAADSEPKWLKKNEWRGKDKDKLEP